jgi:deoxyribodipyrimidine photo-lyase
VANPGRTAIVWFRRDLRLADHPALTAALAGFEHVVPLWVWDPHLTRASGVNRLTFLAGCVEQLGRSLDGRLVVRCGPPARMVPEAAGEAGAATVFVTGDFNPYGRQRDAEVAVALGAAGVGFRAVDSAYAVAPGTLYTGAGQPFQVFTPFSRAWRAHGWGRPAPRPPLRRVTRAGLADSAPPPPPAPSGARLPEPGEAAAHRLLDDFVERRAGAYQEERNRPDLDHTSRLSPYLRFGCLHPRQILDRLEPGRPGPDTFATELCWREFYADVLHHRPDAARRVYRPEFADFPVDHGPGADERFAAWASGRTGYPMVDAGMRQLVGEGWVHNRVRMIVASFLVKDLHLDWSRGARFFMEHLVDADLASNQLNWQWVAGSGTDAAPYYRIFNPVIQGVKFDPEGEYVRRWVPELAHVRGAAVHEPGARAADLLSGESGAYPAPIVDHAVEREEALARYQRVRRT